MEKKTQYTRYYNRCKRLFNTGGKYGKVCIDCDTRYKDSSCTSKEKQNDNKTNKTNKVKK